MSDKDYNMLVPCLSYDSGGMTQQAFAELKGL